MRLSLLSLSVMKYTPSQDSTRRFDPAAEQSLGHFLVASALTALIGFAVVLAILYPVNALGVAAFVVGSLLATRTRRTRKHKEQTKTVCVPRVGVCVEF